MPTHFHMPVLKRVFKAGPIDRAILSHWATELPCFDEW